VEGVGGLLGDDTVAEDFQCPLHLDLIDEIVAAARTRAISGHWQISGRAPPPVM
jgi:hypothetical protein